jgi:hypothetical protein
MQTKTWIHPAENQDNPAASVPAGWGRTDFRPLKPKGNNRTGLAVALVLMALFLGLSLGLLGVAITDRSAGPVAVLIFVISAALLISSGIVIYAAPALIAHNRSHRNRVAIFACNLLFGWTLLGWGATLVWAFTNNTE